MTPNTPIKTLQKKNKQLVTQFLKSEAPAFMEQHTRILDEYFRNSFEESLVGPKLGITRNPYAIIALGGYGREEQCIHSDVDLLFLFKKKVPQEAEELIREVIYPLWDLGLDVGHATRSLKECISLAAKDLEVLTSLLDARFLCGASLLTSELMAQLREKVLLKGANKIIAQLVENSRQRHERFGDSAFLLEPNLKEGQGGIRDYHTMLWISRIESNIIQPRDLERYGYLTHARYQDLRDNLSFIWKVRSHLHHLSGRKCDQLHLQHQTQLAKVLHFHQDNGQKPVEKFLGKLHGGMESLKQQYLLFILEQGYERRRKRIKRPDIQTKFQGLEIHKGLLHFESPEGILKSPEQLIHIFEESAHFKLPLSGEAKQLVGEFGYLVNDDFRSAKSALRSFEKILTAPAQQFNVLNEMLNTGFLARFIPPFKGITNRIQYDEYHLYPVDKHSLLTVRAAKNFLKKEDRSMNPLCRRLYTELSNKRLLLWAALLHDMGKGMSGRGHAKKGAEIAEGLLKVFGFKQKDVETVTFLIEEHLLLANTATRRDINDEETAIFCARRIKKTDRLKMLYLLTVADSMSTGPKAWNDWTAALLRSLFLKVLNIFEKGELATKEAISNVEKKKKKVLDFASSRANEEGSAGLLKFMSPRYLLYTPENDIIEHIRLHNTLADNPFVWNILGDSESNTRTVTVCAHDRPGLFSKIAGSFTLNGLNILDCQTYTWRNNIALDILEVEAPPDRLFENEHWDRVGTDLKSTLSGELDLAEALRKKMADFKLRPGLSERPNQVIIDNRSSSFFTIIEVFTYDFPGLLFSVTDALFRCGLDIWVAKIATKVDQVVDVFYVRDFDGQKADALDQENSIKHTVAGVLPGGLPEIARVA